MHRQARSQRPPGGPRLQQRQGRPEYTLYEVDGSGTILFSKAFGTSIDDEGEDQNDTFDFAWSSSIYYVYANVENSVSTYTFDPTSGDVNHLFDFGGQYFVTALNPPARSERGRMVRSRVP